MQFLWNRYFLIFGFCLVSFFCGGQEGNPFDMKHKLSEEQTWSEEEKVVLPSLESPEDTQSVSQDVEPISPAFDTDRIEGNPFDMGASNNLNVENIKVAPVPKKIVKKRTVTDSVRVKIAQFKIGMSILLLVALALISTLLRHVIIKVFEGFKSDNLLRSYFRSTGRRVGLPNFLLEVFFVVNMAFTCFLLLDHLQLLAGSPIFEFLKLLLAISVIVFAKHLVLFVIQEIFPIKKEVAEYNFTITLFLSILGLILMPCNLILGFAPGPMDTLSLYFIGFVCVLVLGYLAFRGLLIGSKFLGSNRFHFFMYLCTVELAPVLILFKVVNNYIGS